MGRQRRPRDPRASRQRRKHGRRARRQKHRPSMGFTRQRIGDEQSLGGPGSGTGLLPGRTEQMSATQFQEMVNHKSGLLGVSETSSDCATCSRQEAVTCGQRKPWRCFCYQAKKWIGSFAAALGGWIRSSSQAVSRKRAAHPGAYLRRTRFSRHRTEPAAQCAACTADFAGRRSRQGAGHPHDEELMIARSVTRLLDLGPTRET